MSVEGHETATQPEVLDGSGNGETTAAESPAESPPPTASTATTTLQQPSTPPPPGAPIPPMPGEPPRHASPPGPRIPRRGGQPWGLRRSPRRMADMARGDGPRADVRVVDHRLRFISPWSVFKIAGLFYICVLLMFMVAGVLLWRIGRTTETVDQIEDLVTRLGAYGECVPETDVEPGTDFETDDDCPDGHVIVDGFRFNDGTLFRSVLFSGIIFVIAGTAVTVLFAVLINLLNDVTGGVRYTIVREATGPPTRSPEPANRG